MVMRALVAERNSLVRFMGHESKILSSLVKISCRLVIAELQIECKQV